jgi:uncharacterized protein
MTRLIQNRITTPSVDPMPKFTTVATPDLLRTLRSQFAVDWHGVHGIRHWERVRENGLRLARETGANPIVVELFAYLHDSRRLDEWEDAGHGARAAEFLTPLRGRYFQVTDGELELLAYACRHHSDGLMDGDVTVRTCWDADRLDLGRVGMRPDPQYLCTEAARDPLLIDWAYRLSRQNRS